MAHIETVYVKQAKESLTFSLNSNHLDKNEIVKAWRDAELYVIRDMLSLVPDLSVLVSCHSKMTGDELEVLFKVVKVYVELGTDLGQVKDDILNIIYFYRNVELILGNGSRMILSKCIKN